MNVNTDDVAEVLSPIVAGAASLARRLAASKAAANGVHDAAGGGGRGGAGLGPVSPLDVSLDPTKINFYYLSKSLFKTLSCLIFCEFIFKNWNPNNLLGFGG